MIIEIGNNLLNGAIIVSFFWLIGKIFECVTWEDEDE